MSRIFLFLPIFLLCNFVLAQNYVRFLDKYDMEVEDTTKAEFIHFELVQSHGNALSIHRFLKDSTKVSENTTFFDSLGNEIGSSEREFFASKRTKSSEKVDEVKKERISKKFYENGALKSEICIRDGVLVSEKYYDSLDREVTRPVFTLPSPKDGMQGWFKYLGASLRYPQVARTLRAEGTVIITFNLDEVGKIHNLKVLNPGENHDSLEKEAVRVVEKYPYSWVPATENGVPIRMQMNLPIRFQLN